MDKLISELVTYGLDKKLVHTDDKTYVVNQLLELFQKAEFQWVEPEPRQYENRTGQKRNCVISFQVSC